MKILLTSILFFTSIFCYSQPKNEFYSDIPGLKNGKPVLFYILAQKKAEQLSLAPLDRGFDSLQIRIWYDYSNSDLRKLLVLKRADNRWSLDGYKMSVNWNDKDVTEIIKSSNKEVLSPRSGLRFFADSLLALKITTLPHMQNIKDFSSIVADGEAIHIEAATKTSYRFYGYHSPEKFKSLYWQANNVVQILKLIENELGPGWKL